MKFPLLLLVPLLVCSCQTVSIVDQPVLSKTAMSFDATGARSAECSLTSQVERGRSLTNAVAGGGCSSCH